MADETGTRAYPTGLTLPTIVRFSSLAVEALRAAREEIDALNVYPVPDGDTGTNLFLTFESADRALLESLSEQGGEGSADLRTTLVAYARGLLLGARGNSGVIMSQLVGALLRRIGEAAPDERPALVLAQGLRVASEAAYAAVGEPVEGTILTVARAAAEAAEDAVREPATRSAQVLGTAARAAREALVHTPEQLDVLRRAGVVDAGGRGLCVVLDVAETTYTGRRDLVSPELVRSQRVIPRPSSAPVAEPALPARGDLDPQGPAYEVMYLLDTEGGDDAGDAAVAVLRTALSSLGDSLVVVGGGGLWNVHVHVDDVGAAIEAGMTAGRPHRIQVTHFAEQIAATREARRHRTEPDLARGVVVVTRGEGLATVFREAGATVITAPVTGRPSTAELLQGIQEAGAHEVVLIPNDRDVVPTAEAAAGLARGEHGLKVAVIPTTAQVQGMAALAVHEPGRPFEQDLVEMSAAARHARSGAVTTAVRRAYTTAGPCEPGDVLGAVEGDFVVIGSEEYAVATAVIDRMLGGGGELFTVLSGQGGVELAQRCASYLEKTHPAVDVLVYDGGQDRYPVLFGVE